MLILFFFFYCHGDHRDLHVLTHSFPTRRSSDLFPGAGGFPISGVPVSAGYEDKWCRGIDTADPGAVPGGSTTNPRAFEGVRGFLTGPNQDRRVFKDDIFFRAE